MDDATLLVNEIFYSIQGETSLAGFPSLFIRLAGCNLHCTWCDTPYAKTGSLMTITQILTIVDRYRSAHHITITGGEPLLQHSTHVLLDSLNARNYKIQIETNGSLLIKHLPSFVRVILDVKTPSSGHADSFQLENLKFLKPQDEIKFVIADEHDYIFSVEFMNKYLQDVPCKINFSPVFGIMDAKILAEKILKDKLTVRLNLQLHKLVWENEPKNI